MERPGTTRQSAPTNRRPAARFLRPSAIAAALGLAFGLTPPATAMDLQQAYQAALERDSTVRASRAAVEASVEKVTQARGQRYPNLGFGAAYNRNGLTNQKGRADEFYPSQNASLNLRQPIYRRAISVGLAQAQQILAEAQAQLDRDLQGLSVRVADAYMQLLFAQDNLALIQAQKNATTTQLDAARKLLAGGGGTRTDIDEAQARLDAVIAQELDTNQQVEYARRQLEVLTSQSAGELNPLDEARFAAWTPQLGSVEDWLARAEDASPEIRQLKARLETARLEVSKLASGHWPTLDAVAQWTRSASENVNYTGSKYTQRSIGLQLNVPLYAGGTVSSAVRQALAEQQRAEELLDATRRDLSLRIHTEHRGLAAGPLRLHALEQAARSAAQLVVSARRSFAGGSRTQVDILNAEQQKQLALRDLARARYTHLMASVRLQALAGGDREASISDINGLLKAAP